MCTQATIQGTARPVQPAARITAHDGTVLLRRICQCITVLVSTITLLHAGDSSNNTRRVLLTSFYPLYITALNIAREVPGITVVNMTKPQTGCLHDYQLTPHDMKTLSTAWAFVVNGGGMESFVDKALGQRPGLEIIDASRGIELITGDEGNQSNPHVWVSISAAIAQVENIANGLAQIDGAHSSLYRANADAYSARLQALRKKMHDGLANISSRDIITFHEAFPYFAKEFNLNIVAVIQREPGSEPSAGELAKTIRIINSGKAKALFAEPQFSAKAAQTISRETGIGLYVLDPVVSGPALPEAYISAMESNLAVLQKALK